MAPKKIAILGSSGAGKSTLTFALANRERLPIIHLDRITWLEGWVLRDRQEADQMLYERLRRDEWVLDAAFPRHLAMVLSNADQVIFLDFPRLLCVARVAKRIITRYGEVLPEMADGCPERGDLAFLRWIWNWKHTHRPHFVEALKGRPDAVILKSPKELEVWLSQQ